MNGIDGLDNSNNFGASAGLPASNLAWLMFTQTGMPGLYMLYSDLERGDEKGIFD